MKPFFTSFLDKEIPYTGAELSPHWISRETQQFASGIVAFRGNVSLDALVEREISESVLRRSLCDICRIRAFIDEARSVDVLAFVTAPPLVPRRMVWPAMRARTRKMTSLRRIAVLVVCVHMYDRALGPSMSNGLESGFNLASRSVLVTPKTKSQQRKFDLVIIAETIDAVNDLTICCSQGKMFLEHLNVASQSC